MSNGNHSCFVCDSTNVNLQTKEVKVEYGGLEKVINDYQVYCCQDCGEEIVESKSLKRFDQEFISLKRKFENLLTPNEIREIRILIKLTQDEAGKILGGGPKAFAKYENGKIPQTKAMDNLLRILKDHPFAIKSLLPDESNYQDSLKALGSEKAIKYSASSQNTIPFGEPHYKSFSEGEHVWKSNSMAL